MNLAQLQQSQMMPQGMPMEQGMPQEQEMPMEQQQGQQNYMAYATMLAQNPTMEMATKIIEELHAAQDPMAEDFARDIEQTNGDPQQIMQFANDLMQELSK